MKPVPVYLLAAFLGIGIANAQNSVSQPAGYTKVVLAAGADTALSMPFLATDASVAAVVGSQLPEGATVRIWDAATQAYIDLAPNADAEILPGTGFFVGNPGAEQTVVLAGTVVLDAEVTTRLLAGLNLIGFPYSTRMEAGDITLTEAADMELGAGYWYNAVAPTDWVQARPYAGNFPASGTPAITAVVPTADGIRLTIATTGAAGETLDILAKDVASDATLATSAGYTILAQNIGTAGAESLNYNDTTEATTRIYLVGRADIDADGDGLSDARETYVHGTSAANADTDGDGIPDGYEIANNLNPKSNDAAADLDGDGISNLAEYQGGTDPQSAARTVPATIYVDAATGSSANSGLTPYAPKASIHEAVAMSIVGDTIKIAAGVYDCGGRVVGKAGVRMECQGRVEMR